jgi:hypothetical protein
VFKIIAEDEALAESLRLRFYNMALYEQIRIADVLITYIILYSKGHDFL